MVYSTGSVGGKHLPTVLMNDPDESVNLDKPWLIVILFSILRYNPHRFHTRLVKPSPGRGGRYHSTHTGHAPQEIRQEKEGILLQTLVQEEISDDVFTVHFYNYCLAFSH